MTSNAAKCRRSWAGVTMPAWCAPRNGWTTSPGAAAASRLGGPARHEGAGDPGGGDAAADQSPPGDLGAQESTAAVSRESGSESAFTASASALISSLETSS